MHSSLPGPGGVSAWPGGVSAWSGGCLPGPGGVCLVLGGCLPGPGGGVCLVQGGSGIPACTEADTLPPCGQTHTCKNITLATTSLRPVMKSQSVMAKIKKITYLGNCIR